MKKQIVIIVSMVMLLVGCVKNYPSVECDPDTNVLFQFIYKGDGGRKHYISAHKKN